MKKIPFLIPLLVLIGSIVVYYYFFMPTNPYKGKKSVYEVWITENPQISSARTTATAEILNIHTSDSIVFAKGKVLLNINNDSLPIHIKKGDKLLIYADFIESFESYPNAFDYDKYLRLNGYTGSMFLKDNAIKKIGYKQVVNLRSTAENCQFFLSKLFQKYIKSERERAVILALAIGERDFLDSDIRQQYATAGAVHILAVSGLHVGIVLWILNQLFTLFGFFPVFYNQKWRKRFRLAFVITGLTIYAFITGLSPSVVRSTLMFVIFYIGWHNDRQLNTYNNICAAAFIALIVSPLSLFSVSFQLSYSAVLGIVYLHPKFASLYRPKYRIIQWIQDILLVSLAAQIGTLPFSLYYFGQTSIVFFLTNLLIIPLTSYFVLPLAFALILVYPIPFLNNAVAFCLEKSVLVMNEYIALLNRFPFATFEMHTTFLMTFCLIAILLFFCMFMQYKKWLLLVLSIVFYALFIFDYNKNWVETEKTHRLLFPKISNTETMIEQCGHCLHVFCSDYDKAEKQIKNLAKQNGLTIASTHAFGEQAVSSFKWNDKQFLCLHSDTLAYYETKKKTDCDILIVGKIRKTNLQTIKVEEKTILLPDFPFWKKTDDMLFGKTVADTGKGYVIIE